MRNHFLKEEDGDSSVRLSCLVYLPVPQERFSPPLLSFVIAGGSLAISVS